MRHHQVLRPPLPGAEEEEQVVSSALPWEAVGEVEEEEEECIHRQEPRVQTPVPSVE
jgi:hypothetical protein